MPLYDLGCTKCERVVSDRYFHVRPTTDWGACPSCGSALQPLITSAPVPLTKTFGEDRVKVDLHIRPDGKPQEITSWGQRRRLMKEFGLEEAGPRRGTKGCWA